MATNLQIRLDRKLLKLQSTRSTRPGQAQPALSTTVIQRAMGGPDGLSSQDVLQLQRVLGNRAVGELLTGTLQRTIDRPRSPSSPAPQAHPTGLPDNLKAGIESLAGMSMDDVRIHYNSPKPAKVQALAYTQGADIHVAPGQEQHLAHEAWHVVQQKQGRVKPTLQLKKGVGLNDDAGLEKEADTFRRRAMQAAANSNHTWRDRAKQSGDARLAPTALRGNMIQRVIHKGKTLRSQPFGNLKLSGWYESLPSDDHRAWAYELHRREGEHYTTETARVAIDKHITDGDPVPTFDVDPKAERLKRVREYVNTNAPQTTDTSYKEGKVLAEASRRANRRHFKKYKRTPSYAKALKTIGETEPGLYQGQKKILSDQNEWQQIVALTHTRPQTYDFNLGGDKITLDSLDVKANEERSKKRGRDSINLGQLFIDQPGGKNSYWKMSDSNDPSLAKEPPHKKLRHLEVERDEKAAFTTYLKDTLIESGKMTTQQAYGDETPYAFQEYKGALSPTSAMARMQLASAYQVLQVALGDANAELGTQVGARELTTAKKIQTALNAFMSDQTEAKYKRLVKEIYRLIRARTRMDQSSDTEPDSDTDY